MFSCEGPNPGLCLCVHRGGGLTISWGAQPLGEDRGRGHLAMCVFANLRQATWRLILGISGVTIWVIGGIFNLLTKYP